MHSCTFVILGATGDLTKRKLVPAIYRLIKEKKIKKFVLVGVALPRTSIENVLEKSKEFIKKIDKNVWKRLQKQSYYKQLDFYKATNYLKLKSFLLDLEKKHKLPGNRLFYLATMPEHFETITKNLSKSGIVKKDNGQKNWTRVVYEKPFGYDLESSRKIKGSVLEVFDEKQVYRIDHYLGKELVGNIALVRFTNKIFEPLWSNKHIDSVQIVLSEKLGVKDRGKFYDAVGAINDMIQSHMLQIMTLVAMEEPYELAGKYIRDAKENVLKKIKVNSSVVGQYKGYKKEKGVAVSSKVETFAAVKLTINNRRWRGVPFYLKTGKCLDKKGASVHIRFKMVKCLLSKSCPSDANYLTIRIRPDEGFYLELNSKAPGVMEVVPVKMDFCHKCVFGPNTPAAYENLLEDVMRGDQSFFLRGDEIETSWKIVEKIKAKKGKLHLYEKGSSGPKELEGLDPNRKIVWRS